MNISRIFLCFAFPVVLSCCESPKEEDKAEALDGPQISKLEERDMLEQASSGDARRYETLILWYLNKQRYDDALKIAVKFAEYDAERAKKDICELNRVYEVELNREAISAIGGSSEICDLRTW
ncbi:hypothetical protein GRI34_13110 [Erythrobacter aquimaris]|uniref:Tetratricopeptide repeat protein n=1 Tax=Qipengyuania aquimaris TaxID=255984 RepID=A0A6I4TN16_9SPHN|nr:hypothetical protein [Qipengyuania aquimaris]MXO97354.1 hypothetical protein [Qipengyuania aquimaris]